MALLARGSGPWVAPPVLLAFAALFYDARLAIPPAIVALAFVLFFRDPERDVAEGIVCPADGRLTRVEGNHAVTFLNVHNVHVIRAPYAGTVTRLERFKGGHAPAFLGRAKRNAGLAIHLETAWGDKELRLVAGLVARRARSYVAPGETVAKGARIGIILFGSRVDAELPQGAEVVVPSGSRVSAGATQLASAPRPLQGAKL